jgi:hypothetical protein
MVKLKKASQLRQRLRDVESRLISLIGNLVDERGPLVRGTFQQHGTRCGKPNCKCVQGELHPTAVLVVNEEGNRRTFYVRIPERAGLQRRTERYRRFRKRRAELVRVGTELLRLVDELLETLIEPYSPQRRRQPRKPIGKRRKPPH